MSEAGKWNEQQRAKRREEYARNHSTSHAGRAQGITIPADVTVLTRDPAPCGFCGAAGVCRHRPYHG